jgi:hypothetical protein
VNSYRLYLYGRDGAIAQVSEIDCPDDGFATAFAAERRRDFARAELWLESRLVARLDGLPPETDDIILPPALEGPEFGAGKFGG